MTRIGLVAMVVLAAAGSAALAQDKPAQDITVNGQPAPKETPAPKDAAPPKEKKICHSEPITGSLTRVNRICLTAAEWDKLSEETAKNVDDINKYQNRPDRQPANPSMGQGF